MKLLLLVLLAALGKLERPEDAAADSLHRLASAGQEDVKVSPETGLVGQAACAESRRATEATCERRVLAVASEKELHDDTVKQRRTMAHLRASALPAGFLPPSLTYLRRNGQADANGRHA